MFLFLLSQSTPKYHHICSKQQLVLWKVNVLAISITLWPHFPKKLNGITYGDRRMKHPVEDYIDIHDQWATAEMEVEMKVGVKEGCKIQFTSTLSRFNKQFVFIPLIFNTNHPQSSIRVHLHFNFHPLVQFPSFSLTRKQKIEKVRPKQWCQIENSENCARGGEWWWRTKWNPCTTTRQMMKMI